MNANTDSRLSWRIFDGSVSVSASMLLSVLISRCDACAGIPVIGFLKELTGQEDGIIIVATLLLFPTTAALYGVFRMFFAAKEAVEKKAMARGHQVGRQEGIKEGHQVGRQEGIKEGHQMGRHEGHQVGRQEGIQEGRKGERERIRKEFAEQGVTLTPEMERILSREYDAG